MSHDAVRAAAIAAAEREVERLKSVDRGSISTTDTTLTTAQTITTEEDTVGILWLQFMGVDIDGNMFAGAKHATYKNLAGTLTVSELIDDYAPDPDTAVNTASIVINIDGSDLLVQVTGVEGAMNWSTQVNRTEVALPSDIS
jgi:hypothetical protein